MRSNLIVAAAVLAALAAALAALTAEGSGDGTVNARCDVVAHAAHTGNSVTESTLHSVLGNAHNVCGALDQACWHTYSHVQASADNVFSGTDQGVHRGVECGKNTAGAACHCITACVAAASILAAAGLTVSAAVSTTTGISTVGHFSNNEERFFYARVHPRSAKSSRSIRANRPLLVRPGVSERGRLVRADTRG